MEFLSGFAHVRLPLETLTWKRGGESGQNFRIFTTITSTLLLLFIVIIIIIIIIIIINQ